MVIATQMPKILETILTSLEKAHGTLQDRLIVCEKKTRFIGDIIIGSNFDPDVL